MVRLELQGCLAALALQVSGCGSPAPADQDHEGHGEPAEVSPVNAPQRIEGEYRLAGIDGQPFDAPFGVALSIDANTISYDPRCAGFVWTYEYLDGQLSTRRSPLLENDQSGEAEVCEIAVPPELTLVAEALDAAERAERTPENALLLSGQGRSVTLFSQ